jgi:hypothetical protein
MTPYVDSRDGRSLSIYGSECQIWKTFTTMFTAIDPNKDMKYSRNENFNLLHYVEWGRIVTLTGRTSGLRVTLSYLLFGATFLLKMTDLFLSIINLHRHFKYVKKLSNEKFLDIRELDENYLIYYKIPRINMNIKKIIV